MLHRLSLISASGFVRCRAMRDIKALAFVCVLIAACASTGGDGGGDDQQNPPPSGSPVCGDAVCASSEIGVCTADCGSGGPNMEVCGNGKCEGNEPSTCVSDCSTSAVCGNGQCESTENNSTCPGDCMSGGGGQCPSDPAVCFLCLLDMSLCMGGMSQTQCQACIAGGGGGQPMCSGGAPNGMCDAGETPQSCPFDCQ